MALSSGVVASWPLGVMEGPSLNGHGLDVVGATVTALESHACTVSLRSELEVLKPIVGTVTIDVVHSLPYVERPAKILSDDQSMLEHNAFTISHHDEWIP